MLITKALYQVFKAIKMEYLNNYASDCSDDESLEYLSTVRGVNEPEEEIYDPNKLSIIQTGTALRIIELFVGFAIAESILSRWVILLAQMQSGKTDTFLFVGFEMLRLGHVDDVVIFSGNAETDLRDQLKSHIEGRDINSVIQHKFYDKYDLYLEEDLSLNGRTRKDILAYIKKHIDVKWGSELSKYNGPTQKTLFIWEESHFAQTLGQGPDKFLRKVGISANGDPTFLRENGNFVISVSATPFSELSDEHHINKFKKLIKMKPSSSYYSVKKIKESGRLIGFDNPYLKLEDVLSKFHFGKKYGIVRVSEKNADRIKSIIDASNWNYVEYDSLGKKERGREDIGTKIWNNMANEPDENIIILIRGKCRMGKNLEKKHLLFAFETAKNSNTDTILQSLLGRICGYSEGSDKVIVYMNRKFVDGDELTRYINLWDNIDDTINILPRKAMNLSKTKVFTHENIIPIKVRRAVNPNGDNRDFIINSVKESLLDHNRYINKNEPHKFDELKELFMTAYTTDRTKIQICYLKDKPGSSRHLDKAKELVNAFNNGRCPDLGSGGGIDSQGTEVKIWIPKSNVPSDLIKREIAYITSKVLMVDSDDDNNIAKTNLKEIFAHPLRDGTSIECNGGMPKLLSPATSEDWVAMCDELSDFVEVSRDTAYYKGVISLGTDENGEPKGIIVKPQVLKELEKGGKIYKVIRGMGAELRVERSRRVPKSIQGEGFIKLASIKWEFK